MGQFWNALTSGFSENAVNIIVYLAIAALFALGVAKCVLPVWHTKKLLARAARNIRKGEKSRHSWQEDTFLGKGVLYPHWSEYLDNLFFADGEYHNASNVEDYINEDTVITQPGKSGLASAVPGLMISLGFLGTLLGITEGLAGFSMDNSDAVMTAIRTLIPGMRYAFTTSIAGVVCSILFTVSTGIVNGSARSALSDFYAAIHNDAGILTVDPLNQIAIYQQEQTAQVRAMSAELTDKLAAAVGNAMQPLAESLDRFCGYATDRQAEALGDIVSRFVSSMDASLHGQFRNLASVMNDTLQRQKTLEDDLNRVLIQLDRSARDTSELQKVSQSSLAGFQRYISQLNDAQAAAERAASKTATAIDFVDSVTRQQSTLLTSIGEMQSNILKSVSDQRSASEKVTEKISALEKDLSASSLALRESSQALTDSHKAFVAGVNEDLEKTYDAFFSDIGETTRRLEQLVEDVRETLSMLPETVESVSDMFAEQGDRMVEAVRELGNIIDDRR